MVNEDYTPSWDIRRKCISPLVEVRETEDEVIVTADLPRVSKENIEVQAEEKSLTIKAKMKTDIRFKSWGGAHRNIRFNSFRRKVNLPARINPEKSEARFEKGILEVKLKKRKGKKINIR